MIKIECIESLDQLDLFQSDWEFIYASDPQAHIFLSWTWIRGWFEITPYKWMVLAVWHEDKACHIAFLPLIFRGPWIFKFMPIRVLNLGGQPLAPYTGFICLPECEPDVISSLAQYIQDKIDWVRFQMTEVLDSRLEIFLEHFSNLIFNVEISHGMPSLFIPLPDKWDHYLKEMVSSKSRRNLRKSVRVIEGLSGFHRSSDVEDVEIVLSLWQQKWGPKPEAPWLRKVFLYFSQNNQLWINLLWDENCPISGAIHLVDNQKKVLYGMVKGVNYDYNRISPGRAIIAYNIQFAIENGYQAYDLLVGADKYKLSFGAKKRNTTNVVISRKDKKFALILINLIEKLGRTLKMSLGRIKRIAIVKRAWFELSSLIGSRKT